MTWGIYFWVFIVMIAGSTVQSSVGMGQGLIAAPLLRLLHPDLLPGPIVFVGFLTSVVLAVRNSRRTDVAEVVPAIAGRVVGIAIAVALIATLSERGLTLTIAAIVLLVVAARLAGLRLARSPRTLAGTGVASGIGGAIAGLGGAPMGLLYEQHARARDFRGPMGVFQTAGGLFSLLGLAIAGQIDGEGWLLGLSLLPPVVIGWILARWVTPIIDRGIMGPAVLALSASSALALIVGELGIAVESGFRRQALGQLLLVSLQAQAMQHGLVGLSLSVESDNPARHLYRKAGFDMISDRGADWLMAWRSPVHREETQPGA